MNIIEDLGYLAAQCDVREIEATTQRERLCWQERADYLRWLQLEELKKLPPVNDNHLAAKAIIADMEEVGCERIAVADAQDCHQLAAWSEYPFAYVMKPGPHQSIRPNNKSFDWIAAWVAFAVSMVGAGLLFAALVLL